MRWIKSNFYLIKQLICRMAPKLKTVTKNPNSSYWSIDNGYFNGVNELKYPYHMFKTNNGKSLSIMLRLRKRDIEPRCTNPINGFNVFLSTPGDTTMPGRQMFRTSPKEDLLVHLHPIIWKASNNVRDYKPIDRKCFYTHERQLRFFKFYTELNCESECLANFTLRECGCVTFSMPSINRHWKSCRHPNKLN